ncbi:MAG: DUF5694 domain-containing protein [Ferruginibacter sp.]
MKQYCLLFSLLCTCLFVSAQTIKQPDEILKPANEERPTVFLVGAFHFEYPNLDANKVEKDKQIDILSEQKQQELKALLDHIAKFKPNKIAIEAGDWWNAMKKYRAYRDGKQPLKRDERYQIAFRLMEKFNLDTVYSIDASSAADDMLLLKDSAVFKPYVDSIFKDYNFRSSEKYLAFFNYFTEMTTKLPLLDFFKYINSPEYFARDYGAYLLGDFKLDKYRGSDALAMYWYSRNLRIFRNIQQITTSPKDRILVLFGAGHISILHQLFSCSTEYDYIKFSDPK